VHAPALKALALALGVAAAAVRAAPSRAAGPPPPLAGVPLELRCGVTLADRHPLLRPQTGEDLLDMAAVDDADAATLRGFLQDHVCGLLWELLEEAGAHSAPADVRLPARAVLQAELVAAELEGTRVVEQRIGGSLLPVTVPHWALLVEWTARLQVEYQAGDGGRVTGTILELRPRGGAEQEDYSNLRLSALLRGTTRSAFAAMPRILADEGRLGELLFGAVERPATAPDDAGLPWDLALQFWQLLVPDAAHRHDALAFLLASERPPAGTRRALATWFVLADPDLSLRRDALAWLLQQDGGPGGAGIGGEILLLFRWLLRHDASPKMRAAVVAGLPPQGDGRIRDLLVIAAADEDETVSGAAVSALRRFPAVTASDLARSEEGEAPPALPLWTRSLDGRVAMPEGPAARHLLDLARASDDGPAAQTWLLGWLRAGTVGAADYDWALPAWRSMAQAETRAVRAEALARLSRERGRTEVDALLVERIRAEADPVLRRAAVDALRAVGGQGAPGAMEALLTASEDADPGVRAAAASALAQVPGRSVWERLDRLAHADPDAKVRRAARRALRAQGSQGGQD
jgi:HEAT repeat protein